MEKFNHLAAHVREIMVLSDDERINFLYMDRWIGYQRAITVLNMLTDLLNRPKKLRPECLLIVGDSNMGKLRLFMNLQKILYKQS